MVACAAVVAFAIGGGGVFGGLGGLFGGAGRSLQVAKASSPAADIVAGPPAVRRAAVIPTRPHGGALGHQVPQRGSAPAHQGPALTPAPAPPPVPSAPPPVQVPPPGPPVPSPGGGQAIGAVGNGVTQVTAQAPPQAQPIVQPVNDVVDTLVQTCQGLPACP